MLTQVEKNRRARRKEQLKAEAEATKAAQLSKEIDRFADISNIRLIIFQLNRICLLYRLWYVLVPAAYRILFKK